MALGYNRRGCHSIDDSESAYRTALQRASRIRAVDYRDFRNRWGHTSGGGDSGYETINKTIEKIWQEQAVAINSPSENSKEGVINMSGLTYLLIGMTFIIGVILGIGLALFVRRVIILRQIRIAERKAARIVTDAEVRSREIVNDAKQEIDKIRTTTETEQRERRNEIQKQENRLSQKLENLERKLESVESRERNLINKEKSIDTTH